MERLPGGSLGVRREFDPERSNSQKFEILVVEFAAMVMAKRPLSAVAGLSVHDQVSRSSWNKHHPAHL